MSIHDNVASKIYLDLNLTTPSQQEENSQNYWLVKVSQVKAYVLDKIAKREKLAKNETFNYY